jgi:hypothetical protein
MYTCDYGCGFAAAFDAVAEHECICSSRGKQVVEEHQGSGRRGAKGKLQRVSALRLAATVGCKLDLPDGADDDQVAMRRVTRVLPRPEEPGARSPPTVVTIVQVVYLQLLIRVRTRPEIITRNCSILKHRRTPLPISILSIF